MVRRKRKERRDNEHGHHDRKYNDPALVAARHDAPEATKAELEDMVQELVMFGKDIMFGEVKKLNDEYGYIIVVQPRYEGRSPTQRVVLRESIEKSIEDRLSNRIAVRTH